MSRVSRTLTIVNQKGLHARASAKFVTFVSRLPEGLIVQVEKDGQMVTGTSIMGLMMLGAAKGSDITLHVEGDGSDMALEKLAGIQVPERVKTIRVMLVEFFRICSHLW